MTLADRLRAHYKLGHLGGGAFDFRIFLEAANEIDRVQSQCTIRDDLAGRLRDFAHLMEQGVSLTPPIELFRSAADAIDRHAAAIALLKALEWSFDRDGKACCPACGAEYEANDGHKPDCPLAALLADQPAGGAAGRSTGRLRDG